MNGTATDCHVAFVLLLDTSASMNDPISQNSQDTILDKVKDAARGVIQNLLPDHWVCGLATFPNDGSPVWPSGGTEMMEMVTAANRQSLVQAIDNLGSGGSTNVVSGMQLAGWMLETQLDRPRFLALFTDGNLVQGSLTASGILATATQLKNRRVFIITGGYTLSQSEKDLLTQMASLPTAFIDTVNASEITNLFTQEVSNLCRYVPIAITLAPAAFTVASNNLIAAGGQASGGVEVRWVFGDPGNFRLRVNRSWVVIDGPLEFALGPSTPPVKYKFVIRPETPGHEEVGFFVERVSGVGAAAFRPLPVDILADDFELHWDDGPRAVSVPWWSSRPSLILGRIRIKTMLQRSVAVNVRFIVRRRGSTSIESGWTGSETISVVAPATSTEFIRGFQVARLHPGLGVRVLEASAVVFGLRRVITQELSVQ